MRWGGAGDRTSVFFVGYCFHVLFKTARSILVQVPSNVFSRRFVMVQMVQPYSSTDITTTLKNCRFRLSASSDFHMTYNLFVASNASPIRVLISLSVDEILLPRYMNCSTGLRGLQSSVEMSPFFLKFMNSVLSHRGRCSSQPPPGYVVVTQPVPVYLQEVRGHQHSLHL